MNSISDIQRRLADLGLYSGTIDGSNGPLTRAAVTAFQTAHGLIADGIPGPVTQSLLFPVAPDPALGRDVDPHEAEPAHLPPIWPRQPDVERVFGAPGQNQVRLQLPFTMWLDWEEATSIGSFLLHEKVHDSARRCFERIADAYDAERRAALGLDRFGGCSVIRDMRGGSRLSMHAWGIAIDFNPARNALRWGRDRAHLARAGCDTFWKIWEGEGWLSLGRTRNFDWMHVQAARL